MKGRKFDLGKTRWELLPWDEVEDIVRVLMFGSAKYEDFNWQKVPEAKARYFDASMRHLIAWKQGEKKDKETGISHLAHLGCCALFLAWFDRQEEIKNEKSLRCR